MARSVFRAMIAVGLVVGALTVASVPASAATTSPLLSPDPAGDPQGTYRPAGDLTSMRVVNRDAAIALTFTTRVGVNPFTHPGWGTNSATFARWSVDTGNDGITDYTVRLGSRFSAQLRDATGTTLSCDMESAYDAGAYRVAVPKSCLGNPLNIRAKVSLNYLSASVDFAPGPHPGSFSRLVTQRPTATVFKGSPVNRPDCTAPGCRHLGLSLQRYRSNTTYTYTCYGSIGGGAFWTGSVTTNRAGSFRGDLECYYGYLGASVRVQGINARTPTEPTRTNTITW